ncbi:MAG: hypothetical protein K8963_06385, partial [Proteobacteria bacterium]|nr:hypothetical protein [Pseudomonadota bacterium]
MLADLSAQVLTIGSEALSSFPNSGGGFLTSCRVSPDLPSGLSIERTADVSSCRVVGTARAAAAAGTYTVTAANSAGSGMATIDITVNFNAPALQNAAAQTYSVGASVSVVFVNDGGEALTDCAVRPALPEGLMVARSTTDSTCAIVGTADVGSELTTYTVSATNATATAEATVDITIDADIVMAPMLGNAASLSAGAPVNITFSNSGGGVLTGCSILPELPEGLSIELNEDSSSCRIVGTPALVLAPTSFMVTATNAASSATTVVSISVSQPSAAVPVMANLQAQILAIQSEAAIRFLNSGGGELTGCTVNPVLPSGLELNHSEDNSLCVIAGTPDALTPRATYVITAVNDGGSDQASVDITIANFTIAAPVLQGIAARSINAGAAASLVFTNTGGGELMDCTVNP